MLFNYVSAESTVKPAEVEVTKTTAYVRKDITSKEITDSSGTHTMWSYQEAALPLDDFEKYSKIINAKNANDITQLMTRQDTVDDNQLIIMEAIADLYDVIATISGGTSS